jgi:hypothetical protein
MMAMRDVPVDIPVSFDRRLEPAALSQNNAEGPFGSGHVHDMFSA